MAFGVRALTFAPLLLLALEPSNVRACPASGGPRSTPSGAASSVNAKSAGSRPIDVKGDRTLELTLGSPDRHHAIIYLHGVCGNVHAFKPWVNTAYPYGSFIAMRGDLSCEKRRGRQKWSHNIARLNRRITRAIERVNQVRDQPLDLEEVTLIGYSQGAKRAEALAHQFPERYRRVVLIAMVSEPRPANLPGVKSALIIAGARDAKAHLARGQRRLEQAGIRSRYLELPKAGHGEYGPKATQVMGKGLEWLFKNLP